METTCSGSKFGAIAIEKKFVTMEELIEAFMIQVHREMGESVCVEIGDVLVELGYMTQSEVEEVLDTAKS